MFCKGCINISICKHYEYLSKYPELTLGHCELKVNRINHIATSLTDETIKPLPQEEELSTFAGNRPDLKGEGFECTACHQIIYEGEQRKCEICDSDICTRCGNIDIDDLGADGKLNGLLLCDECYTKRHENDIELESDEKSIFEMISENIDVECKDENIIYEDCPEINIEGDDNNGE